MDVQKDTPTTPSGQQAQSPNVKLPGSQHSEAGSAGDKVMTSIIGWVLQGGVILSSVVILIGLIMVPFHPGGLSPQRVNKFPHTFASLWTELLALHPQAVITLGLLLLIATPVSRVAISIVAFALEHDRRYVIITLIVLAILIYSIFFVSGGA